MTAHQTFPSTRPGADRASWKRQTALTGLLLLAITVILSRSHVYFFPIHQVQSQDALPLFVLSLSLVVSAFWSPAWHLPSRLPKARWLLAFAFVLAGLLAFASYALMGSFPLSIDERMVLFDMAVYDRLHLASPVAAAWVPYVSALVPAPLLNQNMPTGLVSSYLPMNALLRLAFSKLADPALFNPLLAVAGGVALLDVARGTFGRDNRACWVVLLVYALSAQMLVNTMTVYSMTGHMALNLIWLAAFLRGGRLGHSIAILSAFAATGLHQIAFHPFFAAPFLLWRFQHGERKLALLYAAAYAAIILWWAVFPALAAPEVASAVQQAPSTSLMARVTTAFAERRGDTGITMFLNLVRFVAWQNLALIPLLSAAIPLAIRGRGLPAALLLGICLWLAFITVVIPFQGHGWGFRYLHPYLGSFALLAGYGYEELRAVTGRRADGLVLALSGVTAVVTIPLLLAATYRFVQPYVALERLVAAQQAPMVLIDTTPRPTMDGRWAGNAIETVRNLPDLSNRPLRISSININSDLLVRLCGRGRIALITRADQHSVSFASNGAPDSPSFDKLVRNVHEKVPNCLVSAAGVGK
ncbi:hypothetical protein ACUXST_001118 [Sphingomonas sp. F9_3S_D5_B_2]